MSQPAELLAFRKRLKNAGYFDIHIKKSDRAGYWIISACEPLGGYRIAVEGNCFSECFRRRLHSHGGGMVYRPASKLLNDLEKFTVQ